MNESAGKSRKRHVDHPRYISKLTCLVNGPRHSSGECKVLRDFGSKYSKIRPTQDRRQDPKKMDKFNRNQDKNDIVQYAVYEIILQGNMKLSVE